MHTVRVQNYQAIEDTTVEIKGFTAIVGPTNIGKSCLVRAIRGLVSNQVGTSFIRNGASKSVVTLQSDDGLDVTWEKGQGGGVYSINGQVYDSAGQGHPEFLQQIGFGEIQSGDQKVMPQIAPQFELPFLMDKSGAFVAEAISSVSGIERITPAVKAAETDLRETKSKLKLRESDLEVAQIELQQFAELDAALQLAEIAGVSGQSADVVQSIVQELGAFIAVLDTASVRVRTFQGVSDVSVPDASGPLSILDTVTRIRALYDAQEKAAVAVKFLAGSSQIVLPDADSLSLIASGLRQLSALFVAYQRSEAVLQKLSSVSDVRVPDAATVEAMSQKTLQIVGLVERLTGAATDVKLLQGVTVVDLPEFTLDASATEHLRLVSLYAKLMHVTNEIQQSEVLLEKVAQEHVDADRQFHEALGESCPLCERSL